LVSALNTTPELRRLTLHDRFETSLVWLRQFGQKLGHSQVALLAKPRQRWFRGLDDRGGALHGEVQRLQSINAEHIPGAPPVRIQPCNLERATPIRAGNVLWHS